MDRITLSDGGSVFEPMFNDLQSDDCGCGCSGGGCGDNKNTNIITIHGQGGTIPQQQGYVPQQPRMGYIPQNNTAMFNNSFMPFQQQHGFAPRIPEQVVTIPEKLQTTIDEIKNGLSRITEQYNKNSERDADLEKAIEQQQKLLKRLENRAAEIRYVEKRIPHYIDRPVPVLQKVNNYIDRPVPVQKKEIQYIDRPALVPQKEIQYMDRPVPVRQVEREFIDRPVLVPQKVNNYIDRPVPVPQLKREFIDRPVLVPKKEIQYMDRPVPVKFTEPQPKQPKSFQYREFA